METKIFNFKARWLLVPLVLMTLGVGNAWGASVTWEQVAWGDITTSDVIIVTVTTSNGTYLLEHSQGTSATPKLGNTGTLTNSNANCTFNENDNVKWKKDANNRLCKASDGTKWLYTGTKNNAMRVGTSTSGNVWTLDGDYIKSNTSTARYLSVYSTTEFRSYTSKQSGQVTRFYKASSCDAPTVGSSLSLVSASTNSITATVPISATGGCDITANGLVYSSTVATPTVGTSGCSTATVTACGSTAENKEVTITDLTCGTPYYVRGYATNSSGTSYTDVKTQSTSACPKYTVTLKDDNTELEQATAGASVTLPSRTGCDGYKFAGWTKSWTEEQDEWTTTAPTIIPAGNYTPTGNENLYPVYTKTEGGGAVETVTIFQETCSSRPTSTTSITNSDTNWDDTGGNLTGVSISGSARTYNSGITNPPCFGFTSTNYKDLTISGINTSGYSNLSLSYLIKGNQSGGSYANYTVSTNAATNNSVELTTSGTATECTTASALASLTIPATSSMTLTFTAGNNITNRAFYVDNIKITGQTGGSTTLYISVPNCCTQLGTINGSNCRT